MFDKFYTSSMTQSTLGSDWNAQVSPRECLERASRIMRERLGRPKPDFECIATTQRALDYLMLKINAAHGPSTPGDPLTFMGVPVHAAGTDQDVTRIAWEIASQGKSVLVLEIKDGNRLEAKILRLPSAATEPRNGTSSSIDNEGEPLDYLNLGSDCR